MSTSISRVLIPILLPIDDHGTGWRLCFWVFNPKIDSYMQCQHVDVKFLF